ncbi:MULTISPECIES: hypothetical protein [Priestia]|nr:hypothetical protein [Priestia megaterium]
MYISEEETKWMHGNIGTAPHTYIRILFVTSTSKKEQVFHSADA